MTPLLVLLFGIHPTTAVGTDLLYAGVTKICGSAVHNSNHAVDWRIVTPDGERQRPRRRRDPGPAQLFRPRQQVGGRRHHHVLGFALILTAVTLFFRRWLLRKLAHALDTPANARSRC
jgi:hypothetical protein